MCGLLHENECKSYNLPFAAAYVLVCAIMQIFSMLAGELCLVVKFTIHWWLINEWHIAE